MGKVLKADASAGDAYVDLELPGAHADFWLTYRLAFTPEALTFWTTTPSGVFGAIKVAADAFVQCGTFIDLANFVTGFAWSDIGVASGSDGGNSPAPVAAAWQECELHHDSGSSTNEFYIGGGLVYTSTGSITNQDTFRLGQWSTWGTDPAAVAYVDTVKAGTTRGGSDLASFDFEDESLAGFTTAVGDVSIVDDPYPSEPSEFSLPLFFVAFDDPTLEAFPDWTQVG